MIIYSGFYLDLEIPAENRLMKTKNIFTKSLVSIILICFCLSLSVHSAELDESFGTDGKIATSVGNYNDQAYAIALQSDGKILVGGSSSNGSDLDFAVVRYKRDGSLDTSFNYDGTVTTQVGRDDDEIAAIAIQEDGYIIAAGYSIQDNKRDFALVKYAPDGQRDSSFGLDGIVITEYGSMDDEITAVAVDDEGRIVIAGYSTGTTGRAVVVGRYLANGDLDNSFGYQGVSLAGIGEDALARSIDLDNDGRIIITGSYYFEERTEIMVLRFNETGELDTSFGEDGIAFTNYTQDVTEGYGVKLHDNGAILVAGSVGSPGELDSALFYFTADGQPQTGFGDNGMLEIAASLEDDMALAVDIDGNTVYLSGFTTVDGVRQFLIVTMSVSFSEMNEQEIDKVESIPFVLKTGNTTTNLSINEAKVEDSFDEYLEGSDEEAEPSQATISQAAFGIFTDDTSYAVAVQSDGMAVAAGMSEDNGVSDFAVARFVSEAELVEAGAVIEDEYSSWITTRTPFEITRTGAISGGIIDDTDHSIVQRGVVFSIAPDPILDSGSGSDSSDDDSSSDDSSSDGDDETEDTTPPEISGDSAIELSSSDTDASMTVTTDENATCKYTDSDSGMDYSNMKNFFDETGGVSHVEPISVENKTYYVRCQDESGISNTSSFTITVTVASSSSTLIDMPGEMNQFASQFAEQIGNVLVGTAHAEDGTETDDETTGLFGATDDFIEEGFTEDGSGTGSYSSVLTGLKPGTFFYIRAYALDSDGVVYYGKQLGFKTADSCFIATAAYGSIMHSSVKILRDFRDQYLLTNNAGKMFVRSYYKYSPPIADVIAENELLRGIVRLLLMPIVGASWLILSYGIWGMLLVTALIILPFLVYRRVRQGILINQVG